MKKISRKVVKVRSTCRVKFVVSRRDERIRAEKEKNLVIVEKNFATFLEPKENEKEIVKVLVRDLRSFEIEMEIYT